MKHKRLQTALVECMANIEDKEREFTEKIENLQSKKERETSSLERRALQGEIEAYEKLVSHLRYADEGQQPKEIAGGRY